MFTKKRIIILIIVALIGIILGRLVIRAIINFLVGGTLFGGNFLWREVYLLSHVFSYLLYLL